MTSSNNSYLGRRSICMHIITWVQVFLFNNNNFPIDLFEANKYYDTGLG